MRVRRKYGALGARCSPEGSGRQLTAYFSYRYDFYGTSTNTSSPRTSVLKQLTPALGFCTTLPVATSYCHPCQGQVTVLPLSSPSPSGPPRCRQVLSMA